MSERGAGSPASFLQRRGLRPGAFRVKVCLYRSRSVSFCVKVLLRAWSLLSCLRPQNDKESCKYFLPLSIEGASAGDVISVGSQPSVLSHSIGKVSAGVSTPGVDSFGSS